MKISQLSRISGVSVASIKYYVREGLLPAGVATSSNQATYDDTHARRLRLIRALVDIGGLSIAQVRATLAAVDDDTAPIHEAFSAVMHGLDSVPAEQPDALSEVRAWLDRRHWDIHPDSPAAHRLAESITTLRQFDLTVAPDDFDDVADAAAATAQFEVGYAMSKPDRTSAVEMMLIGTVVYERAHAEIRRLALEAESARVPPSRL